VLPSFLLPETLARENGSGPHLVLGNSQGKRIQLTLEITRILEKQNLQVSLWGSPDGDTWEKLASYPPKSYCGKYVCVLDLTRHPGVRHLRAEWCMTRWGAGSRLPVVGFYVFAEEVAVRVAVGAA